MRASAAGKYARAVVSAAAARGRLAEAVRSLRRVAVFFQTPEGTDAMKVLRSSRVPEEERSALLDEIAEAFALTGEVKAVVQTFAYSRVLTTRALRTVSELAQAHADVESDTVRVVVRTAGALPETVTSRIGASLRRMLRRNVDVEVEEDATLLAGVVVRAGNHIWDGSLAGRLRRAREAVVASARAAAGRA